MNRAYFERYCGEGRYDDVWHYYSRVEHCLEISGRFGLQVQSLLVLGAGTGRVLERFDEAWGLRPHGCEISHWAWSRIPARYRRRIERADMRRYVPALLRRGRRFDLVFCNSLVYLDAREIPGFVGCCSPLCSYFHFWSSTSEDHEPGDAHRRTLRPRAWWREVFRDGGFEPTRSPYLWRSTRVPLRS